MNLQRLLARYGFKPMEEPFSHAGELLNATLRNLGPWSNRMEEVAEDAWVEALLRASDQVERLGRKGLVDPRVAELPLADIDLHMRGIVRWMNEHGIPTAHCCDGHGTGTPYIALLDKPTVEQVHLMQQCLPDGLVLRMHPHQRRILLETTKPGMPFALLLDYAERLYDIVRNPERMIRYEAESFKERLLLGLLRIPGGSGREEPIRRTVLNRLRFCADEVDVDSYGNVLATRHCGDGPVVLLSAHMDVYRELDPKREILEDGTLLRSTAGILGADDRAGIAVALLLCERIRRTNFRGTLRLAFTVEEEIGLLGARNLDPAFMQDVDAAIVIDRRGNRDIVTSCRGVVPFCDPSYGRLFEIAGRMAGMEDWRMVAGGSSDARVFAEQFGKPAVNLSVGYRNEHTPKETLDYVATYQTAKLIETALHHRLIEQWTERAKIVRGSRCTG